VTDGWVDRQTDGRTDRRTEKDPLGRPHNKVVLAINDCVTD